MELYYEFKPEKTGEKACHHRIVLKTNKWEKKKITDMEALKKSYLYK